MSTTRSPSPAAPVTDPIAHTAQNAGLVLVAHGDRGGEGDNSAVHAHAVRLRHLLPFDTVEVGLLNGEPEFEQALERTRNCGRLHVFPMLMSEGYFTDTAIPDRLKKAQSTMEARKVVLHRPLGVIDAMMRLTVKQAREGASRLGCNTGDVCVFLVGHGAKTNTRAREAIEMHGQVLREEGAFAQVRTGYLEETPFLDDVVTDLDAPTVVVGLFISDGMHAGEDVPLALANVSVPLIYVGALGSHVDVARIIRDELTEEP